MTPEAMAEISTMILAENQRRKAEGKRLLYLIYDQVYRMLTFGDNRQRNTGRRRT